MKNSGLYLLDKFSLDVLTFLFSALPDNPIVKTSTGELKGFKTNRRSEESSYLSFLGIPYAEPPVGNLRWKNPVPHRGWTGVRDALQFGSHCVNKGIGDTGGIALSEISVNIFQLTFLYFNF